MNLNFVSRCVQIWPPAILRQRQLIRQNEYSHLRLLLPI